MNDRHDYRGLLMDSRRAEICGLYPIIQDYRAGKFSISEAFELVDYLILRGLEYSFGEDITRSVSFYKKLRASNNSLANRLSFPEKVLISC